MLILYNPTSSANRKPILPMSLLALGAELEGREEYRIVDGNLEREPLEALDRAVRDLHADVLGVTVMPGPQLVDATRVCGELKRRHPRLTIVWGGYFPTQHYEACLRSPLVDFVLRGHAEATFVRFLSVWRRGDDPAQVPGVASRTERHGILATPLPAIPDPAHLPDFPYQRVAMPRYVRQTFLGSRTLAHHSSYGCPFVCNFCAVVNMVQGRWLAQPAARVADVVARLVADFGANAVEFYDNNFFVDEDRAAEVAGRIRPYGIRWWGEARIDTMLKFSDRTWDLLRQSGLAMVFMGAESGSDETLRAMDKGGTASVEKTLAIAARMAEHGILPEFSFVLGNPPDPETDVRRTIEFIRRLKQVNRAAEIVLYMYTPVPLAGTLYEEATARGFRFPDTLEEWTSARWLDFSQRRSARVPWIDERLRRQVQGFERVLNAYWPTATDAALGRFRRALLSACAAPRYHLRLYRFPVELRLLHRLVPYQRPETSGF
jgi:radical SAM superfamily enzyme YgiQ (UPF0313 family)